MNLLATAFIVRRGLAAILSIGAVFFGYHMINKAQTASVNHSIEQGQKSVEKSAAASGVKIEGLPKPSTKDVTTKRSAGKLEMTGADGTKVTVKGLPTGQ